MEFTPENILQAKKDVSSFGRYLFDMEQDRPTQIRKTFKEMFGYEIILFHDQCEEFIGERYTDIQYYYDRD